MRWTPRAEANETEVTVLTSSPQRGGVLKTQLPMSAQGPCGLLTLLEGTAQWSSEPRCVAVAAEPSCLDGRYSVLLGDELWPEECQLIRNEVVAHVYPERIRGVGDFRHLRAVGGGL